MLSIQFLLRNMHFNTIFAHNTCKKYILLKNSIKQFYKMNQIIEYIVQINTSDYNSQCIYTKRKLLSHDTFDIRHIIFFKKLHVILYKIPDYLSQLYNKIGDKDFFLFKFWDELQDSTYLMILRKIFK